MKLRKDIRDFLKSQVEESGQEGCVDDVYEQDGVLYERCDEENNKHYSPKLFHIYMKDNDLVERLLKGYFGVRFGEDSDNYYCICGESKAFSVSEKRRDKIVLTCTKCGNEFSLCTP